MGKSSNTRVTVPLSEDAYHAVTLIADIGGVSRGRLLADTLEGVIPSFIAIATAFRAAQAVEGAERKAMVDAMSEAESRLLTALSESMENVGASARAAAPGGGARGRADPPILTGGFTENRKGPKDEV